jgi:hypothetical protein
LAADAMRVAAWGVPDILFAVRRFVNVQEVAGRQILDGPFLLGELFSEALKLSARGSIGLACLRE